MFVKENSQSVLQQHSVVVAMNKLRNRNFHRFLELDQVTCVMHLQGVYYDISQENLRQDQRIFYRGLPQTRLTFAKVYLSTHHRYSFYLYILMDFP